MKKIFLWIALSIVAISASAQQKLSLIQMNLAECIAYAQENSPLLLPLPAQLEMLQIDYQTARSAFLPSLNAQIGQNFSFGRSQGRDFVYTNTSSANTSFSLGVDVPIFNGGQRWYQLKKSDAARATGDYIVRDVEDNIALTVTQSYIQLMLAKQLAATAVENLALTQKHLDEIKKQVEVGRAAAAQQIDIESQLGRDQLAVTETAADVVRATRILLLDMGFDPNKMSENEIDFVELTPEEVIAKLEQTTPRQVDAAWVLPATAKLEKELELSDYDVKIAKSALWPSLSLSGGYSNGYYYTFGEKNKMLNQPFQNQLKDNGRYFVGLSLSIPIYNRGQVRRQIRVAELQQANLRSQLVQKRINDDRNVLLARTDLEKADEQYRVARESLALSTRALEMADTQYTAGRIGTYEWEQSKNRRLQAQASYLQAIYNRLLRTINLTYFHTGVIRSDW
ncbi:TolC family protein [Porphyromonas levii]|uniref:TolC family protein n=1 Tax=Porphyromonas levii TaxID=28114 RepID=UPI001B8BF6AA|nr:TolC family protein [Porphyromonas levii]MBR8768891.1 hypothetical protein [Porphyromonas levii]